MEIMIYRTDNTIKQQHLTCNPHLFSLNPTINHATICKMNWKENSWHCGQRIRWKVCQVLNWKDIRKCELVTSVKNHDALEGWLWHHILHVRWITFIKHLIRRLQFLTMRLFREVFLHARITFTKQKSSYPFAYAFVCLIFSKCILKYHA